MWRYGSGQAGASATTERNCAIASIRSPLDLHQASIERGQEAAGNGGTVSAGSGSGSGSDSGSGFQVHGKTHPTISAWKQRSSIDDGNRSAALSSTYSA